MWGEKADQPNKHPLPTLPWRYQSVWEQLLLGGDTSPPQQASNGQAAHSQAISCWICLFSPCKSSLNSHAFSQMCVFAEIIWWIVYANIFQPGDRWLRIIPDGRCQYLPGVIYRLCWASGWFLYVTGFQSCTLSTWFPSKLKSTEVIGREKSYWLQLALDQIRRAFEMAVPTLLAWILNGNIYHTLTHNTSSFCKQKYFSINVPEATGRKAQAYNQRKFRVYLKYPQPPICFAPPASVHGLEEPLFTHAIWAFPWNSYDFLLIA